MNLHEDWGLPHGKEVRKLASKVHMNKKVAAVTLKQKRRQKSSTQSYFNV